MMYLHSILLRLHSVESHPYKKNIASYKLFTNIPTQYKVDHFPRIRVSHYIFSMSGYFLNNIILTTICIRKYINYHSAVHVFPCEKFELGSFGSRTEKYIVWATKQYNNLLTFNICIYCAVGCPSCPTFASGSSVQIKGRETLIISLPLTYYHCALNLSSTLHIFLIISKLFCLQEILY